MKTAIAVRIDNKILKKIARQKCSRTFFIEQSCALVLAMLLNQDEKVEKIKDLIELTVKLQP